MCSGAGSVAQKGGGDGRFLPAISGGSGLVGALTGLLERVRGTVGTKEVGADVRVGRVLPGVIFGEAILGRPSPREVVGVVRVRAADEGDGVVVEPHALTRDGATRVDRTEGHE